MSEDFFLKVYTEVFPLNVFSSNVRFQKRLNSEGQKDIGHFFTLIGHEFKEN